MLFQVSEAPGPINFTCFLTIFGDRVQGTDDEPTVTNAFGVFDEGEGKCTEGSKYFFYTIFYSDFCWLVLISYTQILFNLLELKTAICTFGEKFSAEEVSYLIGLFL